MQGVKNQGKSKYRDDISESEDIKICKKNVIGEFLCHIRQIRNYTMEEVCPGICSVPTMSRAEDGSRNVDYFIVIALLDRMKLPENEIQIEIFLDAREYEIYCLRKEILILIQNEQYEQAEKALAKYEEEVREAGDSSFLQKQFVLYQRGMLEQKRKRLDKKEISKMFAEAITLTAPDYQQRFEQRKVLSTTELSCIAEITFCKENSSEKEDKLKEIYQYYQWCKKREGVFPPSCRKAMQYYAESLYTAEKYKECIKICSETLEELSTTSKLENRCEMRFLKAKAEKQLGFQSEEQRAAYEEDLKSTYYVAMVFHCKELLKEVKQYIEQEGIEVI